MDSITNRYIILAVGVFIIVIIVTAVVGALNEVGDIYMQTQKTNISIKDRVDNIFNHYDNATLNGVDLVNALKRYEDDNKVNIVLVPARTAPVGMRMSVYINNLMDANSDVTYKYYKLFNTSVDIIENDRYTITFTAM